MCKANVCICISSRCSCSKFTLTAENLWKWSWKLNLEFLVYISNSDRKQRSENSWEKFETILKLARVFFPCTCPCHHFHEKHTSKKGNLLSCPWVLLLPSDFSWKTQMPRDSVTALLWLYLGQIWIIKLGTLSVHELEFELNCPQPTGCWIEIWISMTGRGIHSIKIHRN